MSTASHGRFRFRYKPKKPPKLCKVLCKLQMPSFFTDLKGHKFPEEKESGHVASKHKWQVLFNLTGQKFQTIN